MPSTFFTGPPHWHWLIALYFFVGGIAGGCAFLAAMLHLAGRPVDRSIIKLAYYVAFVGVAISGVLLIADLGRSERFWHMMIQSKTGRPMFKYWSPMSMGAWALLVFGLFAFLGALGALHDDGRVRWRHAGRLTRRPLATVVAIGGGLLGLFLSGYTGVLLTVTNRPIWADSHWLGALYLFSAVSSAAALLIILARRRRIGDAVSLDGLQRFDRYTLVLEAVALVIFLVSLGPAAQAFRNVWGGALVLVMVLGILAPMIIAFGRVTRVGGRPLAVGTAAVLVLVGGFMIRIVTILPSERIHVSGARVAER